MTNFTRPGASSSTVWMAPARTEAWRVNGLVTAGNSVSRDVLAAAWPSTTNVSRDHLAVEDPGAVEARGLDGAEQAQELGHGGGAGHAEMDANGLAHRASWYTHTP